MHLTFLIFLSVLLSGNFVFAQNENRTRFNGCTTGENDSAKYMLNAKAFLTQKKSEAAKGINGITSLTSPYLIKCFIRIFRNTDQTSQAVTIEQARQNFDEMAVQFFGHDICFQLIGIDFMNDDYGNTMPYDTLLGTDYKNYLTTKRATGCFTIFIHNAFVNSGSSGYAYGIPNDFVSIARWAALRPNSSNVRSIFAHEVGHGLGLYHTFQRQYYNDNTSKAEQVTRLPLNSCYSCESFGDLCCDTPADFLGSQQSVNASCVFIGTQKDTCGPTTYAPSIINIMSYMPWGCISATSTGFTTDQETRMQATINDNTGPIYFKIAPDVNFFGYNGSIPSGFYIVTARNTLTNSGTGNYTGSSNVYLTATNTGSIVVGAGVTFSPSTNGLAMLNIAGCN